MSVRLVFNSVWRNPGNRGRRLGRLGRAVRWQVRKRVARTAKVIQLANGMRFNAYPDCVVSSALVYSEWPEYWELRFVRQFLQPGEAIIDVGANVGHISLLLADIAGPENIFAFEPTPISFRRLVENWTLNGWDITRLFPCAVGGANGAVRMPDTARPETTNSISAASVAARSVAVRLASLDSFRPHWSGRRVGLLKIDVEGSEREVFAGAGALLREDRARLVMFESLGGALDEGIASLLAGARYSVFQLDDTGRPSFGQCNAQNLFAIPDEQRSALPRCTAC
jgi:FkbM family methyltransferase